MKSMSIARAIQKKNSGKTSKCYSKGGEVMGSDSDFLSSDEDDSKQIARAIMEKRKGIEVPESQADDFDRLGLDEMPDDDFLSADDEEMEDPSMKKKAMMSKIMSKMRSK